jgi:hypothetical protein
MATTLVHAHLVLEVTHPWPTDGQELAEFVQAELVRHFESGGDDAPRFTVHTWAEPTWLRDGHWEALTQG